MANDHPATDTSDLLARHRRCLGSEYLFYDEPLHIVRGDGVWLFDAAGSRYLDCYNNVACVGHAHPRLVQAVSDQLATLNTHSRYLDAGIIEYAERLTATFPSELSRCYFTCTGTEANDLAVRIARSLTGHRGVIAVRHAYHGNSGFVHTLSTHLTDGGASVDDVVFIEPPNTFRGPFTAESPDPATSYANLVDKAIAELERRGHGTAAFVCDAIFDTQGTLEAPPEYFQRVYEKVSAAGGLCIADEVQAGFARTGTMWGFQHDEVVPDLVTLGKPMGGGYPLAGVVTSKEIADEFSARHFYFNTFAGTPVAAAAGNMVLEIIEDESLVASVAQVGAYLRAGLDDLASQSDVIGDVRGKGLFLGLEFVDGRNSLEPARKVARTLCETLKDAGILCGTTGRFGNVLKIRPPLVFTRENADLLLAEIADSLGDQNR